jgi:hypothetical protein
MEIQPDRAQTLLAAWHAGFVSSSDIVGWADAAILKAGNSSHLPGWLLDLPQYGPEKCLMRPEEEFLPRRYLSFEEEFACWVARLELADNDAVSDFACWIKRASIGEDFEKPEVSLGYQVDHLWGDCERPDLAIDLLRQELPAFAAKSRELAATILDLS